MWGGLYDDNYADHNAILGEHTRIKDLFLAVGFSGHGAMEGPAVGKCMSELIHQGQYRTIDAAPLSMKRFKENNLVLEKIVI
jgi:glycine/D-amino acid oxidase-like deaminating enzyme